MAGTRDNQTLVRIGELARMASVPATTLRYYEREGMLAPTARTKAGYRLYGAGAVQSLAFIRSAQAVGFTLDDIRTLLQLDRDDGRTCQTKVQRRLEQRIADVDEKLKELQRVRDALRRALGRCRRSRGQCALLKEFSRGRDNRRR